MRCLPDNWSQKVCGVYPTENSSINSLFVENSLAACPRPLSAPRNRDRQARTLVSLRDRCSFGRFPWLISQALSVTYMAGERRLYLERNCRLPESPAHSRRRNREGPASSKGLNSQRGFGPSVEPRRKSRPRSTSLHGSSPCKYQRLSTLRWDRLPPSRPSTKSGARAGGRRLSDRRLHRWLAGTSASAPSSHGAADLLGLNRAHICVRNQDLRGPPRSPPAQPNLTANTRGWLAYSLMSRSCAGWMRGGDGDTTSPPVTVS